MNCEETKKRIVDELEYFGVWGGFSKPQMELILCAIENLYKMGYRMHREAI